MSRIDRRVPKQNLDRKHSRVQHRPYSDIGGKDFADEVFEIGASIEFVEALASGAADMCTTLDSKNDPNAARLVAMCLMLEQRATAMGNQARALLHKHEICACVSHATADRVLP